MNALQRARARRRRMVFAGWYSLVLIVAVFWLPLFIWVRS